MMCQVTNALSTRTSLVVDFITLIIFRNAQISIKQEMTSGMLVAYKKIQNNLIFRLLNKTHIMAGNTTVISVTTMFMMFRVLL